MPSIPSKLFRRVATIALAVLAALPVPLAHAVEPTGHLAGTLVDSAGVALTGAQVTLTDPLSGVSARTVSDGQGRYGLDVAAGRFDLEVSGQVAGRAVTARVNGVSVEPDTRRDVLVVANGVTFDGTVRHTAGDAIPSAWVRLDDPGIQTDGEGRFSLRQLPGSHRLSVSGNGFDVSVEAFNLKADTHRDLVIPTVPIQINVLSEGGHTVDDAWVELNSTELDAPFELLAGKTTRASNWISGRADASGHVELNALPTAGRVRLGVHPPQHSPLGSLDLSIDPLNAPRRIDVTLPWLPRPGDPPATTGVSLTGTVRNVDGSTPTGELAVALSTSDGFSGGGYAEVHDGTFTLTAPPGTYGLNLWGSDYGWHDDEDGSDHDGYEFTAAIDTVELTGDRTVALRLPFTPGDVTVTDHTARPASGQLRSSATGTQVEFAPGLTGRATIANDRWADEGGHAAHMTMTGAPTNVTVEPDTQTLSSFTGTVPAVAGRLAVTLPTPIPVRFIDDSEGQARCLYLDVTDADGISRRPGQDPTCTAGLKAGDTWLSVIDDDWGDSGDYNHERYWIQAAYTVSGPATLDLHLPTSHRAHIDVVNSAGNPLGGVLTMDSATETVDLGSGISANVSVSNRYEDEGDGGASTFDAHLFGPSTFSGTFRTDRGPYPVSFRGLPLGPDDHLTIAYPAGEPSIPNAPLAIDATATPGGAHVTWPAADDGGSPITEYELRWDSSADRGSVILPGSARDATITPLTAGTEVTFGIKARSALGESSWNYTRSPILVPTAVTGADGPSGPRPDATRQPDPPATSATNAGTTRSGYWALTAGGRVYSFGDAAAHGTTTGVAVDLEPTSTGKGYWILKRTGTIQAFGDAAHLGDVDMSTLANGEAPASLSATPSGRGYWVFTDRGRTIAFGDAPFLGDVSTVKLNGPVLGSVATPSGRGYYMVASDGGIFTFGDANFLGSMGGTKLNAPVQSLVPDSDGKGYWLVASDGGIFAFDAPFKGSLGGVRLNKPVVGMVRYGDGYLMVGADGGIFDFSSLPFSGSLGDRPPASPVVAVAALPV